MTIKELIRLDERPGWAPTWSAFHEAAGAPFFTSLAWIQSWVNMLPIGSPAWLFECMNADEVLALGLLVRSFDWLGGIVPIRRWWLHATGRSPFDDLTIEFNGLVSSPAARGIGERQLLDALDQNPMAWDQLMVPHAIDPERWVDAARSRGYLVTQSFHPCYFVDFEQLRAASRQYASVLTKKTRYLIRRARKEIESEHGPIGVKVAESGSSTEAYFEAMLALHERHWQEKGLRGAFADPAVRAFHLSLQRNADGTAACRMYRVHAGKVDVGYLYLFVWKGVAYFYQSGFNYDEIGRSRSPGYVTIAAVLEVLERSDASRFEFLAGENLYKSRLATGSRLLCSLEIQRPTLRNKVLNFARSIRRRLFATASEPRTGEC
ncbi:MAG: GNAT family N-acetyltransferase [Sinobacteraceae bacterium]|nr:GNAT family N-acetyltransferase [Pseudomonadales bacterium]MCP5327342.1 GNAT family N-acetyltransferase [Nevskiaceae bacterium]MCP5470736.1 GNAT family N-acetyltransferase [Nevskiaceae bacterium]